ncbi:expressed unknown protein [Seminavis robusta]|uniref:RanBP2-type domain-containing protein n=1 Tax=Seminavis robusta TaxID=568900 RepID=A0A9N8DK45_9STRA|nr:expressed unknown protein [Seminavis robusta]|eukprot:Sro202_g085370.1 n/a (1303) ;mRNA; f:32751-36659
MGPSEQDTDNKNGENLASNQQSEPAKDAKRANRRRHSTRKSSSGRDRSASPRRSLEEGLQDDTEGEQASTASGNPTTLSSVDEHERKKQRSKDNDSSQQRRSKSSRKHHSKKTGQEEGNDKSLGGMITAGQTATSDPTLDVSQPSRKSASSALDSSAMHSITSDTTGTTHTTTASNASKNHLLTQTTDLSSRKLQNNAEDRKTSSRRSGNTRGPNKVSSSSSSKRSSKETRRRTKEEGGKTNTEDGDTKPEEDAAKEPETPAKADNEEHQVEGNEARDGDKAGTDESPAAEAKANNPKTEEDTNRDSANTDFGHLPDFKVADFSFRDLAFGFDSGKNEFSEWDNDNSETQDATEKKTSDNTNDATGMDKKTSHDSAQPPKATDEGKPPEEGTWVCQNCQEEHDEAELQFCGMCGQDRPKTTPQSNKPMRKPSAAKRKDGGDNHLRRQGSRVSDASTGRSASTNGTAKRSVDSFRSSSARRVRRGDRATMTPRSRSRGKARRPTSVDRDSAAAEMLVIKCLDGDGGQISIDDLDQLNEQFSTFESPEPPATPSRAKKKTIGRSQSDVSRLAGQTPTSLAPQTPRSMMKKKGLVRRSQSFADAADGSATPMGTIAPVPPVPRKPAARQVIPRRAKSSTTEYLEQLQQQQNDSLTLPSQHGDDELKTQSAHSTGRPNFAALAARTSLMTTAIGRPSLAAAQVKSASQRLLGGLVKSQKTVENALSLARMSSFSKPKGDVLPLDSDDEDDGEEFASDSGGAAKGESNEGGMLRGFGSSGNVGLTKPPGQPQSCRNLMGGEIGGDALGVPTTPRRPQSSRNLMMGGGSDDVTKTPRRPQSSRNLMVGGGNDDVTKTPRRWPQSSRNLMMGGGNDDVTKTPRRRPQSSRNLMLGGGNDDVTKTPRRRPQSSRNLMLGGGNNDVTKTPRRRPQSSRNLMLGGGNDDMTKTPRRPQSSRNLMIGGAGDDAGVMATPRRSRASLGIRSRPAAPPGTADVGLKTPRRGRRGSIEMKPALLDESTTERNDPDGALDCGALDVDIDEDDYKDVAQSLGGVAPAARRTRERAALRPMPRRDGADGAKMEQGVGKTPMTARSRIRRATLATGSDVPAAPDLTAESKQPVVPATPKLSARRRIRRASLGHDQVDNCVLDGPQSAGAPPLAPASQGVSEAKPQDSGADAASGNAHVRQVRANARPGRAGRRGSIGTSNPMLKQAIAHMPQDLTHAVRGDLKQEWERQEQMDDMRKKAMGLQQRYASLNVGTETMLDSNFASGFNEDSSLAHESNIDYEESGVSLALDGDDSDVSDLSG